MDHPYTVENESMCNVTVGSRYFLDPTVNSPSLRRGKSDPSRHFVLNWVQQQVFQNVMPLNDSSVGGAPPQESQMVEYMKIREAKRYFEENKPELLKRYQGMFIAILDDSVVDCDKEFCRLAERVYERFGYQTVFMPLVQERREPVRIPSPRVQRI
jgi:hypothetical protein